jgi:hypothetical protein
MGQFPLVAVIVGAGLLLCAIINTLSRAAQGPSIWFFWLGVAVIVAPVVYRLCSGEASVGERVALVCLLGLSLYLVKLMRDPSGYSMPDEWFHAYNAQQIVARHELFSPNSLLTITPKYPGLEGATSSLMSLTGMSSFGAGLIMIAVARLVLIMSLFVLFAKVSGSYRVAGLGAAAYAGNSNFLYFGAMFSYESLALPLFVVVLAMIAARSKVDRTRHGEWAVPLVLIIAAIVVTHHLTSYFLDVVLVGLALVPMLSRGRLKGLRIAPLALVSVGLTVAWLMVVASETVGYISPVVDQAFKQTLQTLTGESSARVPFQAGPGGIVTPAAERIMGFAAVAVLLVALPFGLVAMWRKHRRDLLGLLLALAGLAYFGVLGLRLAPSAWEVANRTNEFLFVGLGLVVAYAVVSRLPPDASRRWTRIGSFIVAVAAAVAVVGGAITGWPVDAVLSSPIKIVASGHREIYSQPIALGKWVRTHLPNDGFGALDADARPILLYGDKRVYIEQTAGIEDILTTPSLSEGNLATLRAYKIRYVVVDERLRARDASRGYGFSMTPPGGPRDELQPPSVAAKFARLGAPLIYDDGNIFIYDLKNVR